MIAACAEDQADLLAEIWTGLLADDRERYEKVLAAALEQQQEYLTATELAVYERGKRLRPMLLLLCARMLAGPGPLPEKVLQGAVSLEMLHVATLIHDDVIDESSLRRGAPSVNAVRGRGTAVIVGDLQFVQAIRGFVAAIDTQRDMVLVGKVLDAAFDVCRGELDELATDVGSEPAELLRRYRQTVDRKTAALIGLACESGVALVDGRTSDARRIGFYGRRLGRAFQMMDDVLDLVAEPAHTGKPWALDLRRRRPTLPLIHAMGALGPDHAVSRILRGEPATAVNLAAAVTAVRCSGACAQAYADARAEALDALQYLTPFPRNRYRAALARIALHVVDRTP
jgi:heptaprenyl diphosphate synthase